MCGQAISAPGCSCRRTAAQSRPWKPRHRRSTAFIAPPSRPWSGRPCRACRRRRSARRPPRTASSANVSATATRSAPRAKPGSTWRSTARAVSGLLLQRAGPQRGGPERPRLPMSATRLSSIFAPAPTPMTTMRPPVARASRLAGKFGRADQLEDDVERARAPRSPRGRRPRARPSCADRLARVRVAHRGRDLGARGRAELHGGGADAARRAVDEQALAGTQAPLGEQRVVGGGEDLGQATGLGPAAGRRGPA